MRNFIFIAGLTLFAISTLHVEKAEAYSSAVGVDPKDNDELNGNGNGGYGDYETKTYVKSQTATLSGAVSRGHILSYGTEDDGYTLTRSLTRSIPNMRLASCMAIDSVATGDTNYHRCITRGFVRVKFDATSFPIVEGVPACVDASGNVTGCNNANGEATTNSGIIPLESRSGGTGNFLRAILNLK